MDVCSNSCVLSYVTNSLYAQSIDVDEGSDYCLKPLAELDTSEYMT